jgi:hypothetical protein
MKNEIMKILCYIILLACLIDNSSSNIFSADKGIIESLNLRLIRKGINDSKPNNFYHIAIKFKVYDNKNGKLVEVYRGEYTSIMGINALPQCMDYALFHMSIMERVKINCPAKWAFRDSMVSTFKGVEKFKDYVIDMQVWNIGDKYKSVE